MEPTTPVTTSPGRGLQPRLSLARHGRTSAVVALLLVLLGLPLVWIKGQSFYVAEAVFQVSPNYQKNLSVDKELEFQSNSQYREFVNHLSRSVLRYDVIERALKRLDLQGVQARLPAEDDRKAIERLQRTVYVLPLADTYMVRVGLNSTEKGRADDIVNAIMGVFLETARDEQLYGSDERLRALQERAQLAREEVRGFERQRAELAGRLGLTTFGENTANPYDALLAQSREKLTLASIERAQAQAALDAFNAQKEAPQSAGRSVLEMRLQDNGLQALRNEVVKRSEELNRTVSGLEPRHPARAPALAEQQEINTRLQGREEAFDSLARSNVRARLTASLQQARQVERELAERVRSLEGQASTFATHFREAMRLTGEIKRREQELEDMRNRSNFLQTERNAIGFVRLITPALPADRPQGIGKAKLLAALLGVATLVWLLLPVVLDLLDRRVIAPADAERAMGIAAAGWLVRDRNAATGVLLRDQVRRLASTLMRNRQRGAGAAFAFSSVAVGGGTTQLVIDLARTLSQLGQRVLVVDANSHALGSPLSPVDGNAPGLSELLAGRAELSAVVSRQNHDGEALHVVPYGRLRDGGIQRLDRLRDALAAWQQDFDLVLVDVAPVLPSADAELLIDTIGQMFLVVEAESVSKRDVVRARLALEKMAPQAVGLIVNKVHLARGGADLHAQVVETITRGRFEHFMTQPALALQWQLLLARLGQWRQRRAA